MKYFAKIGARSARWQRYAWVLAIVWTVVVAGSLLWNVVQIKEHSLEVARIQARSAFKKDIVYRRWNAIHGGVYVPVTEKTQPNPYLDVPEREIITPSGKMYTLINPAYMTRQMYELAEEEYDIYGHITSLDPIRPENAADIWETQALQAFERGETEISSVEEIKGQEYMRLMSPLITEKSCLKCHAAQGYREGDIRGGISVSVPMAPLLVTMNSGIFVLTTGHSLLWLMGLLGIVLGTRRLTRSDLELVERKQAEEEIRKFKLLADTAPYGVAISNIKGDFIYVNNSFSHMHGYTQNELIGWNFVILYSAEKLGAMTTLRNTLIKKGTHYTKEWWRKRKDGTVFPALTYGHIVKDDKGNPLYVIGSVIDITERKRVEEALRESEERYRALLNLGAEVGEAVVMLQDTEQGEAIQTFVSDEWPRITGYSRKGLLGMSFFDLLSSKHYEASLKRHRRKMTGENIPGLFEMSIIRKDGVEVPIELTGAFTTYQGKRANVAFIRDITERKRVEEEVGGLAKFPSENPNPVLRVAKDGTILYVNQSGLPLLNVWGCQVGQIISEYWHKFVLDVLGSGSSKNTEIECEARVFSLTFAPVVDMGYVNLYGLDITERKQVEEALQESEKGLRNLFETMTEGVVLIDRDGQIVKANPVAERIAGLKRSDIEGHRYDSPDWNLLRPDGTRMPPEEYAGSRTMKEKRPIRNMIMGVGHPDDSVHWINVNTVPIINKVGEIDGIVFTFADITERKQAEEREKQLQQELNLSSRLASIGELAAGVAHEINNPLTGILAFSQRRLRKSTDKEVRRDLNRIHNEAQRAANVVKHLLTFARRREPKREYSDINDILRKALELRTYEVKTSNIEVVTDLAPSLPKTMVDFGQIQQVFLNIIMNAEQAMTEAKDGGKISIKTQQMKDYIRISFTDDGPGIPAESLDKVFDPFFTIRGKRGGTGLGLSVCHGIVTEHGGRIYAKSQLGKGATFFVELPLTTKKIDETKRG